MQNLTRRWRALWNPDMYHGWGRSKSYFEGWYFKIVDEGEKNVLAIIPGISMEADGTKHAFIQILDGVNKKAEYIYFDEKDFEASDKKFDVRIGKNRFSAEKISLDSDIIHGKLEFKGHTPWPKMLKAPGIMGWYSFVPFMECYHGIVSLHHQIRGSLNFHGRLIDFNNGVGYMEKDWGTSFPECWIWIHSNHFEKDRKISLFASVAKIPWIGSHFIGFIAGFYLDDTLYRFATYTGAKMTAELRETEVEVHYKDRNKHIQIIAHKAEGADLRSPISGMMTGKVNESIQARVDVSFWLKGELIYEGHGTSAGLELAGDIDQLLTK